MAEVVSSSNRDGIMVVVVDNPPVNALGIAARQGLHEALNKAASDTSVHAVVVACAGRSFFSGADIKEFGKPPQSPTLQELLSQFDNFSKPVVAAIHGNALGGGLELALCCHFRVSTKDTRLGLPEVKLGLLPGAGGTQRLPRLVGPVKAVQMIVSGDPILGAEALQDGLIDGLFEGDPAKAGQEFARKVLSDKRSIRRVRDNDDKLAAAKADRSIFTKGRAEPGRQPGQKGWLGPLPVLGAGQVVQLHALGGSAGQGGVEGGPGSRRIAPNQANGGEAEPAAGGGHGGNVVGVGPAEGEQRVVALLPGGRQVMLQLAGLVAGQVGVGLVVAPQQQAHAVGGGYGLIKPLEQGRKQHWAGG